MKNTNDTTATENQAKGASMNMHQEQQSASSGKGNRLEGITQFLGSLGIFMKSLSWLIVVLFVVSMIGLRIRENAARERAAIELKARQQSQPVVQPVDWSAVDAEMREEAQRARLAAKEHADGALQIWCNELSGRIDEQFIPWYFGYWNQKALGFRAIRYWLAERGWVERFIGEQPSMAERITEDIQTEFALRVLRPAIAQREIDRMTRDMVEVYLHELVKGVDRVQQRHRIPQPDWDAYLADMALTAHHGGPDTTQVSLKTVYVAAGAGGVVMTHQLYRAIREIIGKIGKKTTVQGTTTAGKAAAATAAKTGASTSAKVGMKALGPIVLAGVLIWDVIDHNVSRGRNEPILRQNMDDYLEQLHAMLLDDPESGMMMVVREFEQNLAESQQRRQNQLAAR